MNLMRRRRRQSFVIPMKKTVWVIRSKFMTRTECPLKL